MLALMHISTVNGVEVRGGHSSATAMSLSARSSWRRFLDALLMALASPSV
jgi:hypothetical protein